MSLCNLFSGFKTEHHNFINMQCHLNAQKVTWFKFYHPVCPLFRDILLHPSPSPAFHRVTYVDKEESGAETALAVTNCLATWFSSYTKFSVYREAIEEGWSELGFHRARQFRINFLRLELQIELGESSTSKKT